MEDDKEQEGWYRGRVTSNRRDKNGRWQSHVFYDPVGVWEHYRAWHYLDGGDDSERWRPSAEGESELQ